MAPDHQFSATLDVLQAHFTKDALSSTELKPDEQPGRSEHPAVTTAQHKHDFPRPVPAEVHAGTENPPQMQQPPVAASGLRMNTVMPETMISPGFRLSEFFLRPYRANLEQSSAVSAATGHHPPALGSATQQPLEHQLHPGNHNQEPGMRTYMPIQPAPPTTSVSTLQQRGNSIAPSPAPPVPYDRAGYSLDLDAQIQPDSESSFHFRSKRALENDVAQSRPIKVLKQNRHVGHNDGTVQNGQSYPTIDPELFTGNASGIAYNQSIPIAASSFLADTQNLPQDDSDQDSRSEDEEEEEEEEEEDQFQAASDALLERQVEMQDELGIEDPMKGIRAGQRRPKNYFDRDERPRRGRKKERAPRVKGAKRGPRKAAEPTGDVKMRLNWATEAFMSGRLDDAIDHVSDAIRINAETYRAWTLFASILKEKGEHWMSLQARVYSNHLQPRDVEGWMQTAELAVSLSEDYPEESAKYLEQASFCFSRALRTEIENRPARHGRAVIAAGRGYTKSAAKDYLYLLERDPIDIFALRGLTEMNVLLASTGKREHAQRIPTAIDWYSRAIDTFRTNGMDARYPFEWQDIDNFVGLLAYSERYRDALFELKSLARWLLGRSEETYWDGWQDDDREWDVDDKRRQGLEEFQQDNYPIESYGVGLPLELRTKLAIYRIKLEDLNEAMVHIDMLDPKEEDGEQVLSEQPHLLAELAMALHESGQHAMALRFFEYLLPKPEVLDASALVAAGRCYLDNGDKRQAEECFTAAIDAEEPGDEACIEARYELAKMYEEAREAKEAYILVNEAIKMQNARDEAQARGVEEDDEEDEGDEENVPPVPIGIDADDPTATKAQRAARPRKPKKAKEPKPPKPPRVLKPKPARAYKPRAEKARRRPRLFARSEEVKAEDERRTRALNEAWQTVHNSRAEGATTEGDGPSYSFMWAARELVDDFRSCKNFYSWDKYLSHLGLDQNREIAIAAGRSRSENLIQMKERLSHDLNPNTAIEARQLGERSAISYRGVPFSEWLDLFLEYALGLAQRGNFKDAYKVCESARDAEVFGKKKDDMFIIHVAWAACALRGRDEETCVATARFIMRECQFDTDGFRMYAALSRLCPSPASWYASGPVQKYMLRQIKLMDRALCKNDNDEKDSGEDEDAPHTGGRAIKQYPSEELDFTLLMLYGHILFVSNSFIYALNYFLRALSLDPNSMLANLSVGHCYLHYAFKRQSENRQYHLIQAFVFLHKYYEGQIASSDATVRQEAHYNMARSYHAIGVYHLATEYYQRALRERPGDESGHGTSGSDSTENEDLSREAAYNLLQICWAAGDTKAARSLAERYLML
ncbi:hypothetical protein F5Y15DRAFT_144065 [Xylariaceae sp. FL0016]|nr:hypothetical protein F5Y15DRAFT_144065 [Xylariaceae sp. FL0016]